LSQDTFDLPVLIFPRFPEPEKRFKFDAVFPDPSDLVDLQQLAAAVAQPSQVHDKVKA
jgi:hypothetical protein